MDFPLNFRLINCKYNFLLAVKNSVFLDISNISHNEYLLYTNR